MNKRHGQQVKRVRAAEHALRHDHHRKIALDQNADHRCTADGNGDGRIQGKQHQQGNDQDFGRHEVCSLKSDTMAATACRIMTIPLIGSTSMTIHLGIWRAGDICSRTK